MLAVSGNLPGAAVRSDPDASTAALPLGLVRPAREAPAELADGRSLGAADAPIVIESWSDFQCAVCGRFAIEMEPRLIDEYVRAGKVRIVARDLAFLGIRAGDSTWDESIRSAAAARCAGRQDRFWQFHDWLFANQGSAENSGAYSQKRLEAIAKAMGLEMQDYQLCMAGGDEDRAVIEETASGQAKGLASAPSFYFNGEGPLAGLPAWASLKEFLDLQLGAGPSPVPSATPAPSASPPS